MRIIFTIIVIVISQAIFSQQKFFITQNGNGSQDGTSWSNASSNLGHIVNNATSGDTIWVAEGIYKGGFEMKEGVSVFGGFSGTERDLSQRKLPGSNENLSILDGDSNYRVLTQKNDFATPTVWDGFIIQNGNSQSGAGVYLRNKGIVRRCIIKNNYGTLPSIGDYLSQEGGVVFKIDKSSKKVWIIADEEFDRNYQIYQESSTTINDIESAVLDMNGRINTALLTKSRAAQAIQSYKGGDKTGWYLPSVGEWSSFMELNTDGTFNQTKVYEAVESSLLANGKTSLDGKKYWSSTSANHNDMAAAWYVHFGNETIEKVNVWQYNQIRGIRYLDVTTSDGKGGGVYSLAGGKVEGCLITDNYAASGSGVYARGEVVLLNNTIVKNILENSSLTSSAVDANSVVKIYNSIIAGNLKSSGDEDKYYGAGFYGYSAVEASSIAFSDACVYLNGISDVKFVDASAADYRLTSESPLANAGNITYLPTELDTDLGYKARTDNQKVSIGAFQHGYTSGINNASLSSGIIIYPNPVKVNEFINVDLGSVESVEDVTIEIYDIIGKKVLAKKANPFEQIRTPQSAGTYILKIKIGSQSIYEYKLIVNK